MIARLLDGGPSVLATGGGAYHARGDAQRASATRRVSIWLQGRRRRHPARVKRRADRPLLQTDDPAATIERLIAERIPSTSLPISRLRRAMCRTRTSSRNASTRSAICMPCGTLRPQGLATQHDDRPAANADPSPSMSRLAIAPMTSSSAATSCRRSASASRPAPRRARRHRHRSHGGEALAGARPSVARRTPASQSSRIIVDEGEASKSYRVFKKSARR